MTNNEMHEIVGANEATLEEMMELARNAQLAVLDAAQVIRESQPAATMDRARLRLADATGNLSGLVNRLYEALAEKEWCNGCGSGAPGVCKNLKGETVPCTVCPQRSPSGE